jgi:hypothetical protein
MGSLGRLGGASLDKKFLKFMLWKNRYQAIMVTPKPGK